MIARKSKQRKAVWTTMRGPKGSMWKDNIQVRKRIRHVSRRRASEMAAYRRKAKAFVLDCRSEGRTCEVVNFILELHSGTRYGHAISNKITEVHHRRGRVGRLLLDQRWWQGVSKLGHRWIHEHPQEASLRGWLAKKGEWGRWEP